MKHTLSATLLLLSQFLVAQNVDYNTIILPKSATNIDFSEKLVRLAWENNPNNEIVRLQKEVAENELARTQWDWANYVTVSGNMNEFNITGSPNENQNNFYPRYNINLRIPLGSFGTNANSTKIARGQAEIAAENVNAQKIAIRAEVLRRYNNYQVMQELYKIETETVEDASSAYLIIEQRFRNGEIPFGEYQDGRTKYNAQMARKLNAESNFFVAKVTLEELIGVRIEDVN